MCTSCASYMGLIRLGNLAWRLCRKRSIGLCCTGLLWVAAGKTTLLDVLAGRKTTGFQTGDILVNGQKMSKTAYRYYHMRSGQTPTTSRVWCLSTC